jgi:hypothetical protein
MNAPTPVFVAEFADGERVRMSTHCPKGLDWERGRKLAQAAWQTRMWQRQVTPAWERIQAECQKPNDPEAPAEQWEKFFGRKQALEKFQRSMPEVPEPPEITECHFECGDGTIFKQNTEALVERAESEQAAR